MATKEDEIIADLEAEGSLTKNCLMLTEKSSRACGHLAGEGCGGSPEETSERHRIRDLIQQLADLRTAPIAIYAEDTDCDDWIVDVIEPNR